MRTKIINDALFDDEAFKLCVYKTLEQKDFVAGFDRLCGTNIQGKGSAINRAIDEATGRTDADLMKFFDFVRLYVYQPLQEQFLEQVDLAN